MGAALKFRQAKVPKQSGEWARLKVVQGSDIGVTFVILGARAVIGRGEGCDVMISDLKASRTHAELTRQSNGVWAVRDLGSSNGISYGGRELRATGLRTGDTFGVGETILEFVPSEAGTEMLLAPAKSSAQIDADRNYQVAHQERLRQITTLGGVRTSNGGVMMGQTPPKQVSPLIWIGAMVLVAALFGSEQDQKPASKKRGSKEVPVMRSPSSVNLKDLPEKIRTDAEMFYKAGFREYREGNFLRAISNFDTVLSLTSQGHPLAKQYRDYSIKAIEKQTRDLRLNGQRALEAGRLKEARGNFESVIRLNFNNQADPAYKDAEEGLKAIAAKLKDLGLEDRDSPASEGVAQ